MKVGYVQTSPIFGSKEKNFEQVEKLLNKIKADIIVLPELFATGYTFISKNECESLAESLEGKTAEFLIKMANLTDSVIIGGFVEKKEKNLYNSAMIVSKSGVIGSYRKLHLYYKEKLWFSQGDKPMKLYNAKGAKIGIMICFDWIFPETARTLALLGADLIVHPSNLVLPYCQKAMVTRCLENRIFSVTANRIGEELRGDDNFKFTGASQITSYDGKVLSSAPNDKTFVDLVDIDIEKARDKNLNDFNNLFRDRHTKFYYFN
ncbi:MAG: nitrilase-related carbon-nitrogen hydrolase [Candidatus Thorarchaeota archaeon]